MVPPWSSSMLLALRQRISGAAHTRRPEHCRFFTSLVLIWILACISGWAQSSGGIQGTVANASGAPLPNVRVSVRSVPTGETRTVLTHQQGIFSALGLSPGGSKLTASLPGFFLLTATASVEAGVTRTVNVVLQREDLGNKTRSTISGAGTGTSSTGGSVNSKTVRDLPSNGRDWTQAATAGGRRRGGPHSIKRLQHQLWAWPAWLRSADQHLRWTSATE
ncbi:MAG: hypothetical protein DMG70_16240 [Acidobacteria bacterium]|nr:MAG: hypothetical protein DMG70_16240 [Acidobacteriota bacterium]